VGSHDLNPQAEPDANSHTRGETPSPASPPIWLRVALPSVGDLIFVLLLASMTIGALAPRLLGDAGTGWHIRNGELILRTRSITRTDPFSATMNGQPWYAWEWLYDVEIAGIHRWTGLNGVVFLTALVIASSFTLTFWLTLRRGASLLISLVLLILALGASAIHLFARPHVLSWLLAVIWFWLLDSSEGATDGRSARQLIWLPAIMLLWVNVHGGFVLGFVLCGIYLVSGLVTRWQTHDAASQKRVSGWLRRLTGVTGVALLAGLVNPFGYKLYVHVYEYLSDRFLMNHIDEFRSPDFHGIAQQCFAALLLITIVALAAGGRRLRNSQLLVILFAAYSGLYASRSLPVSALLLTLILSPLLSQTLADASVNVAIMAPARRVLSRLRDFSQRMTRAQAGFRGHLWPALAVLMGLTVCLHHGMLGSHQLMRAHFSEKRFPVEAVNVMEQRGLHQPIFSEDYWGGYLIYRLYPQNQVFVDDRHDFYGDAFLKRYLRIIHVEPGWEAALAAMNPDCILLPRESSLTTILKEMPQWKVSYEDATAVLFEKMNAGSGR
jgi:hypothetical protein